MVYEKAKVVELENMEELSGKDLKNLENYQNNQPVYETIISALQAAVSEQVYDSPKAFMPVLTKVLANATADKKLLDKVADGLSGVLFFRIIFGKLRSLLRICDLVLQHRASHDVHLSRCIDHDTKMILSSSQEHDLDIVIDHQVFFRTNGQTQHIDILLFLI